MKVLVIDHGAGNLVSMAQALAHAGAEPVLVDSPGAIEPAAAMVLPGVGSTGAAMAALTKQGLVEPIREWSHPLLGVCVGMQLFFDYSFEDDTRCLGLMAGSVQRLNHPTLPHMGWNDLQTRPDDPLLAEAADEPFYFVHSFAPVPDDPSIVVATADYGDPVTAVVRSGNRVGVQFHPERSGHAGRRVMANFVGSLHEVQNAS